LKAEKKPTPVWGGGLALPSDPPEEAEYSKIPQIRTEMLDFAG